MSNLLLVHSSEGRDELLHYTLASLNLYEVEKSEETLAPKLLNGDAFPCLKCLAWSADGSSLATGNFEGRVSIFSVNRRTDAPFVSLGDLLPMHSRPCSGIAWNAAHKSVLAVGFDEHSTDMSLFIVNLTRCLTCRLSASSKRGLLLCPCETSEKVQYKCGSGESTDSVVWQRSNANVLLRGASKTCIQVLDLRCGFRPQICVTTKATCGLDVDYFRDTLVSSYDVNVLKLWDLRRANHRLFAIDTPNPIMKSAWNPNRSGSLAYLYQYSKVIKTCQAWCASKSSERTLSSRSLPADMFNFDWMSTFSWLPSFRDCVVAASDSQGVAICRYGQSDLLAWNANNELLFSSDSKNIQCKTFTDDISVVMKRRAQAGYGLPDGMVLSRHAKLCDGDEQLTWLWSWLETAWKLQEEEHVSLSGTRFPGIKAVLLSSVNDRCMSFDEPIAALAKGECRQINISQNRANCLTLCGWNGLLKSSFFYADPVLLKLFEKGDYERALFITAITKRLPLFRNLLAEEAKSSEKRYNEIQSVMALILATPRYSGSLSVWNATCANLQKTVENNYLKGLLSFFSEVNGGRCSIEDVLELQGIAFCDKVAMALLYLPMHRLMAFVDKLLNDSWASGSLYGLLCTGISAERDSVSLIQNYLDRSSDVQTAAVLFILNGSFAFSLQRSSVVYRIVNSYLTLLDSWQLWKERAELHQAIANHDPNNILNLPCTVLGCSYCQQPIYSSPIRLNQWHTRVAYCPECKRPLPQCALCSLNVGFAPSCKQEKSRKTNPLSTWLTSCQRCKHGGHMIHLKQWFQENRQCPVPNCGCNCSDINSFQ